MPTDATLRQRRLGLGGFRGKLYRGQLFEGLQQPQPLRVALLGIAKAEAMKRGLEDGSYWVEQQPVVTFQLGTIERCAAESLLLGLPHEILQRIAQMAFRPRHQISFELPERMMPPVVEKTWLARGGQCLVFPCALGYTFWDEEEEKEWGSEDMPYPSIRLPTVGHILYFELLLDDTWNGSEVHVHDAVFSIGDDAEPSVNGTVVMPWLPSSVWGNHACNAFDGLGFEQRLSPWQLELNAANKPFWGHLTTGETSWHLPPASPPDWRSFYPCKCESCGRMCARLTLGLLVDLSAGFVTFRLNQVNGPRVPLGAGWQDGVEVRLGGSWPEPENTNAWQVAIEQPLRVPEGLYESPALAPDAAEWDPGMFADDRSLR